MIELNQIQIERKIFDSHNQILFIIKNSLSKQYIDGLYNKLKVTTRHNTPHPQLKAKQDGKTDKKKTKKKNIITRKKLKFAKSSKG